MEECPFIVRWVVRSIPRGGPIELVRVPDSAPKLFNKGHGTYYSVCVVVHLKDSLLVTGNSSP